jgi:hypothetical protein
MSFGETKPGGPIYFPSVYVPDNIRVIGDLIHWSVPPEAKDKKYARLTNMSVVEFSKLHCRPPQAVADFAAHHGVFGLKRLKDGAPKMPNEIAGDGARWLVSSQWAGPEDSEPISAWQSLSRRAFAILRINAALKKGRRRNPLPFVGLSDDWLVLGIDTAEGGRTLDVEDGQFYLCLEINDWLETGGVGLRLAPLEWSALHTSWKLEMNYFGFYDLFGALAYRLLLMVAGEESLYVCDGCSNPYIRTERAPRAGQENFCSDECRRVGMNRATQRSREKRRKTLHGETRPE